MLVMALACGWAATGGHAASEGGAPLSAIDWLSNSIATPSALPERGGRTNDVSISALPSPVTTLSLDATLPDAVGLISARDAGLPSDLWGASPAAAIAARLSAEPLEMLPAMQDLLRRILLAELDPPVDANTDTSLFLARVDRLLQLGMLDEADALLDEAPQDSAALFRRSFDVALLTGSETEACRQMADLPQFSPTYPARIFCLARLGDWQAAALTLESANAIGILSPEQDHLVARFLDPELFEGEAPPPAPRRPTPLDYRLYEAIGEPKATAGLPIAFAHADLRSSSGWKARIEAAERLAETGAIPAADLFELYRENRPSAAGGVWERASAIQRLDAALRDGEAEAIETALPEAWAKMAEARLEHPFATIYGADVYRAGMSGSAELRALAFRIGLVSPQYAVIAGAHRPADPDERFLVSVARGLPVQPPARNRLAQAVWTGFTEARLSDRYATMISEDRRGEALLDAIARFSEGAFGDFEQVSEALALFRTLDLDDVARSAALELLILERRG